jgi:hypothetical protein
MAEPENELFPVPEIPAEQMAVEEPPINQPAVEADQNIQQDGALEVTIQDRYYVWKLDKILTIYRNSYT